MASISSSCLTVLSCWRFSLMNWAMLLPVSGTRSSSSITLLVSLSLAAIGGSVGMEHVLIIPVLLTFIMCGWLSSVALTDSESASDLSSSSHRSTCYVPSSCIWAFLTVEQLYCCNISYSASFSAARFSASPLSLPTCSSNCWVYCFHWTAELALSRFACFSCSRKASCWDTGCETLEASTMRCERAFRMVPSCCFRCGRQLSTSGAILFTSYSTSDAKSSIGVAKMDPSVSMIILGAVLNEVASTSGDMSKSNEEIACLGDSLGSKLVDVFLAQYQGKCRTFEQAGQGCSLAVQTFLQQLADHEADRRSIEDGIRLVSSTPDQIVIGVKTNPLHMAIPSSLKGLTPELILTSAVASAFKAVGWDTQVDFSDQQIKIKKLGDIVEELIV